MRQTLIYNDRAMLVQAVGYWLVQAVGYWLVVTVDEMRGMIKELSQEFISDYRYLHY